MFPGVPRKYQDDIHTCTQSPIKEASCRASHTDWMNSCAPVCAPCAREQGLQRDACVAPWASWDNVSRGVWALIPVALSSNYFIPHIFCVMSCLSLEVCLLPGKAIGISQLHCNCVTAVGKCSLSVLWAQRPKCLSDLANSAGTETLLDLLNRTSFLAKYRLLVMFPVDLAVTVAFICSPVLASLILEEARLKNLSTEMVVLHKPCQLEKVVSSSTSRLPEKITFGVLMRGFTALLSLHLCTVYMSSMTRIFANSGRGIAASVSTCKCALVRLDHKLLGFDT